MERLKALPQREQQIKLLEALQVVVPDDYAVEVSPGVYRNVHPRHRDSAVQIRRADLINRLTEPLPRRDRDRLRKRLIRRLAKHGIPRAEPGRLAGQLAEPLGIDDHFLTAGPADDPHIYMQFPGEARDVQLYDPQDLIGLAGQPRVVVIQNSHEPAGKLSEVPAELGLPVEVIHADDPAQILRIPEDPAEWDWHNIAALIVMGGPPNVHETDVYPWLRNLTRLIRYALERQEVPYVGVCLGCQLGAHAAGIHVTRQVGGELLTPDAPRGVEKGYHPIVLTPAGRAHWFFAGFPAQFTTTQLHGDTVALPAENATVPGTSTPITLLATGESVPVQAIAVGQTGVLILSHLEFDPEVAQAWLAVPETSPDDEAIIREAAARYPDELAVRRDLAAKNFYTKVIERWRQRRLAAGLEGGGAAILRGLFQADTAEDATKGFVEGVGRLPPGPQRSLWQPLESELAEESPVGEAGAVETMEGSRTLRGGKSRRLTRRCCESWALSWLVWKIWQSSDSGWWRSTRRW